MELTQFTYAHIPAAEAILAANRLRESAHLPCSLPEVPPPPLTEFTENGLGFAAVEADRLLGFLCCLGPWQDHGAFRIHVPLYGHGVACDTDSRRIYEKLYMYAAEDWVSRAIRTHAITLYAHEETAIGTFFNCGFGKFCMDEIRSTKPYPVKAVSGVTVTRLSKAELPQIRPLRYALHKHLAESPCFLQESEDAYYTWLQNVENSDRRTYAAWYAGKITAYMDVGERGDSYISAAPSMQNLLGAYCLPQYRGRGIAAHLLSHIVDMLRNEGYEYLGVDHESANLCAMHFWQKAFIPYTFSLLRRI